MLQPWLHFLEPYIFWGTTLTPVAVLTLALLCLLRYRRLAPQTPLMLSGLTFWLLYKVYFTARLVGYRYEWLEGDHFMTLTVVLGYVQIVASICFWSGLILVLRDATSRLETSEVSI